MLEVPSILAKTIDVIYHIWTNMYNRASVSEYIEAHMVIRRKKR